MSYFERTFGLDDAVFARVMSAALQSGGDYCDLYFQQQSHNAIGLEDEQVNRAYRSTDLGVGIRVVKGETTGYAFCEDLEQASMIEAAAVAAAIANGSRQVEPQAIKRLPHPEHYPIPARWSTVKTSDKLPLLERLNQQAAAYDPRIKKVRIRFADAESHLLVVDSTGRKSEDYQPMTVIYLFCVAEDNGRREENYYTIGGRRGFDFYQPELIDRIASSAARRTLLLFDAVRPAPGEMPVVLAAGSSGILLHEAIGHGMEADFNRKGISIYADQQGKPICQPLVSIVDDGTVPSARGSINVDDEGNASERTVLVEQGVLRSYLHDRISARHYGVEPTGSGRRQSFRHVPLPRMRNTYMLPGPHAKEEIIRSVQRGIYAVTFTNGQVQIGAGDFTFYIKTGYLIEDGKLTAPIKDVNLIGNGPRVLRDVTMVGDDLELDQGGWTCGKDGQSVPVSLGMPTVKVSAVTVGGVSQR
jgi:TldD protein